MALSMRLSYNSRNCPLCSEVDVNVPHYILCPEVKVLWDYVFYLLRRGNVKIGDFEGSRFGFENFEANTLLFYAYCIIYRCFVHKINVFAGPFDLLDKYRQMIFRSCLLYTSPSPRDRTRSRMPSS